MDAWEFIRQKIIEKILRVTEKQAVVNPLPGLVVSRREFPTPPNSYILLPSVCIAVQGAKRVLLSNEYYVYDVEHFLLTSLDLPVTAQVIEASKDKPYIGITLQIDKEILTELIVENSFNSLLKTVPRGISLGKMTPQLLDAFRRLLELLDEPEHISALLPVLKKEIVYRLLNSEVGPKLVQILLAGNRTVMKAIDYLKEHFSEDVNMKDLADLVAMSVSTFYQHFKALTGMTPLQYQKKLRLCEARRLIIAGSDVTTAAYRVGYVSLSQFSREYKKFFGILPSQDVKKIRQGIAMEVVH